MKNRKMGRVGKYGLLWNPQNIGHCKMIASGLQDDCASVDFIRGFLLAETDCSHMICVLTTWSPDYASSLLKLDQL